MGVFVFFLINLIIPALDSNRTVKIGLAGKYTTSSLPISISSLISDGLTKMDAKGVVSPALASSWETPDKGKTWIFTIKEGATWQDGRGYIIQYANKDRLFYLFYDQNMGKFS